MVKFLELIYFSSEDKLPKVYEVNHDSKIGCDLLMPTTIYNDPMSVRDTLLFLGHGKFITTEKLFVRYYHIYSLINKIYKRFYKFAI